MSFMACHRTALFVAALCVCLSAQPTEAAEPFFPTTVGTRWVYLAGSARVTEIITGINDVNGEQCLRIETRVNEQPLSYEHVAVRDDGIYRVAVGGEAVVPPLCFLKLSAKAGERWNVKSKIEGAEVSGQFVAGKTLINVPAGRYTALTAHGTKFQSPAGALEFTYYYAPGIGKVKQVISMDGKMAQLELAEFVPQTTAIPEGSITVPDVPK